eukprot:scaffold43903_cov28-Tisochrysis_lutea.AAC.1
MPVFLHGEHALKRLLRVPISPRPKVDANLLRVGDGGIERIESVEAIIEFARISRDSLALLGPQMDLIDDRFGQDLKAGNRCC